MCRVVRRYHHPHEATWKQLESPTTATLYDVAALSRDFVWAVGEGGVVVHTNAAPELHASGHRWRLEPSPTPGTTLRGIQAVHRYWMIAVGDGGTVAEYRDWVWRVTSRAGGVAASVRLHGVGGSEANDVVIPPWPEFAVAVGDGGTILHYVDVATLPPGTSYTPVAGGVFATPGNHSAGTFVWARVASGVTVDLYATHVENPFRAWACGAKGSALWWDGRVWTAFPVPTPRDL